MDAITPPFTAVPPPSPLDMPVQSLRQRPVPRPAAAVTGLLWRRLLVVGGAVLLTIEAAREMTLVLGADRLGPLALAILAIFVLLFAWIALSLISGLAGFVQLLRSRRTPPAGGTHGDGRVALLMPAYNEHPARIMAALAVTHAELARLGAAGRYDLFVLSDTTDPDAWVTEEAAFLYLRDHLGPEARVFYRRRARNTERKAGNIADWVRTWGGAYPLFMILDADSVMTGPCIAALAAALDARPGAGLVQSLPVIVGGQTLFARMQQFAGRLYGPMIAHGIAWWHGSEGNYWGHNAMIRTSAFAEAAGLPTLPGRKPFGGHVLSHDFVEAALIRRAGWTVHMLAALPGSYEECPPSLIDLAVRDRRWCQGNLQHAAVLPTRGLHWISRLHLLMGIGSYVTAPLWLLFLVLGILVSLEAKFATPDYFPAGPALFPTWPVVDPVRSMWVFIGTMGVLLLPKLLAWFAHAIHERRAFGGAVRMFAGVMVETVLAGLLAPITMLTQSGSVASILLGRDGGWTPQHRTDGRVPFADTLRAYLPHTVVGALLGFSSWAVSLPLLLWMSPVVTGLTLAAPLAALTGRRGAGRALRAVGLLRTPEEAAPPAVLTELARLLPCFELPPMTAAARLRADSALFAAHLAMLPPARRPGEPFDAALLLGLAKLSEMRSAAEFDTLPRAERAAVLGDEAGVRQAAALPCAAVG